MAARTSKSTKTVAPSIPAEMVAPQPSTASVIAFEFMSIEAIKQLSLSKRSIICQQELRVLVAQMLERHALSDVRFYLDGIAADLGRGRHAPIVQPEVRESPFKYFCSPGESPIHDSERAIEKPAVKSLTTGKAERKMNGVMKNSPL